RFDTFTFVLRACQGQKCRSFLHGQTIFVDKPDGSRYKRMSPRSLGAFLMIATSRTSPVLNEERRRAILEILERDGRVLVGDLARQFHTSQVTIRKDLEILSGNGRIHRTHGGALPARESALDDPTLREKEKLNRKEKLRLAAAATRL